MYLNLTFDESKVYELGEVLIDLEYKGQLACNLDKLK